MNTFYKLLFAKYISISKLIIITVFIIFLISNIVVDQIMAEDLLSSNLPFSLEAAEEIMIDYEQNQVIASGDVIFSTNDLEFKADSLVINVKNKTIEAVGDKLKLISQDQELLGKKLVYNYSSMKGSLYSANTKFDNVNLSGAEIKIIQDDGQKYEIKKVKYTTCKLEDPHYHIKAKEVEFYKNRIVARRVSFHLGQVTVFYLPVYVLEYDEDEPGIFKNVIPIKDIGYSIEDGLTVELLYPYQINKRFNGNLFADIKQKGDIEILSNNYYKVSEKLKLVNKNIYRREIIPEKINTTDIDRIISGGFNYHNLNLDIDMMYNYHLDDRERKLVSDIDYNNQNYNINVYHLLTNEELKKRLFQLKLKKDPVFTIKYSDGYDLDYSPYLKVNKVEYQLLKTDVEVRTGLGRVIENGISADKADIDFNFSYNLINRTDMKLSINGKINNDIYYNGTSKEKKNIFKFYQTYHTGFESQNRFKISPEIHFNTDLNYRIIWDKGEAILPSDQDTTGQFIDINSSLKFKLPEVDSYWQLGINGEYVPGNNNWDSLGIELTRNYDCFSYSVEYDALKQSIGFSFNM